MVTHESLAGASAARELEKISDIDRRFTYHPPKGNQRERYEEIRDEAKKLALVIVAITPYSREQSLALTNLEQACFWANAAIARNE